MTAQKLPAHSPLGASGASRWMACPGSVERCEAVASRDGPEETSPFAAEGTAAHKVAEDALESGKDTWEFVGRTYEGVKVDADMAVAVDLFVRSIRDEHGRGIGDVEVRFHCPDLHPQFFGTADFVYADEATGTVHVWDYKHGQGVLVEAKDNPQLQYYAWGALENMGLRGPEWKRVHLHVVQPRASHPDGPVREWVLSCQDLREWGQNKLLPAMHATEDEAPLLVAGLHCRFCRARGVGDCPAIDEVEDRAKRIGDDMERKEQHEVTGEEISEFLGLFEILKMRHKAASAQAFHRLNTGKKKVPGYKLVGKKGNRAWRDPDEAERRLVEEFGDKAFEPRKLKSPAQISKMAKGAALAAELAMAPEGPLTLVAATDARPEVSNDTKSAFAPAKRRK